MPTRRRWRLAEVGRRRRGPCGWGRRSQPIAQRTGGFRGAAAQPPGHPACGPSCPSGKQCRHPSSGYPRSGLGPEAELLLTIGRKAADRRLLDQDGSHVAAFAPPEPRDFEAAPSHRRRAIGVARLVGQPRGRIVASPRQSRTCSSPSPRQCRMVGHVPEGIAEAVISPRGTPAASPAPRTFACSKTSTLSPSCAALRSRWLRPW